MQVAAVETDLMWLSFREDQSQRQAVEEEQRVRTVRRAGRYNQMKQKKAFATHENSRLLLMRKKIKELWLI